MNVDIVAPAARIKNEKIKQRKIDIQTEQQQQQQQQQQQDFKIGIFFSTLYANY